MEDIEKLLKASRPKTCRRCLGRMIHVDNGVYRCQLCGTEGYDDLGKIKRFLELNGAMEVSEVAKATRVSPELIELCLKDGKLEMPEIKFTQKCGRCGCGIPSGRFCRKCKGELAGGIKAMFDTKP